MSPNTFRYILEPMGMDLRLQQGFGCLMIQNVLMVCIGNICRSPMAEVLLATKIQKDHPLVKVHSAGIGALVNHPADLNSIELMQERNIDLTVHRARQLTPELIFGSDLILTMTTDQQQTIEEQYPAARGRVHRLGKWGGFDIPDPYKRPRAIFEQSLAMIDQGIDEWYRTLWN